MELGDGDAGRIGPGQMKVEQGVGGEPGRPPERFVDAVLVEERVRGVSERASFDEQDPSTEALVLRRRPQLFQRLVGPEVKSEPTA
ncbi:hypothetical protein ABZY68_16380 [Streptomyces sp. NPDC006482]|uniref:hypothetical protein n=1 Tax=Streptomyces sp. NPDC006482 TaxID=3154306 RepID=UPI0033AD08CD